MAVTVTPWNDLTSQNSEESNADIEKNSNLQGVLKKVPVALQSGMGAPPRKNDQSRREAAGQKKVTFSNLSKSRN